VCTDDLCNAPFTIELPKKLQSFLSSNYTNNNTSDYVEAFFKFANITGDNIYRDITVPKVQPTKAPAVNVSILIPALKTVSIHALPHAVEIILPRAEALKHEGTVPSEDDEDDSEGSGAYEDSKIQRHPASDPAAPSSFLPAQINKAQHLIINFLVATPILLYLLV
jgi:hypothetical protein